jgi:hypothetical protein
MLPLVSVRSSDGRFTLLPHGCGGWVLLFAPDPVLNVDALTRVQVIPSAHGRSMSNTLSVLPGRTAKRERLLVDSL